MMGTEPPNTKQKPERIAICVCSIGRESLIPCLQAILRQRLAGAAWIRVVLIDNTSNGELTARLKKHGLSGDVTIIHEARPGIPMARNAALEAALPIEADLIAFIDDDEIVSADWLPSLHAEMMRAGADVVQGRQERVGSFSEALALAASSIPAEAPARIRQRKTASTCNVLFRSWLIAEPLALRFDENLVRMGEDTEFFMRASDAGARIFHTRSAPVFEAWPAERNTLEGIRQRSWQGGAATNYRYRKNRSAAIALGILLPRGLWRAITGGVNLGISLLPGNPNSRKKRREKGNTQLFFALGCLGPYFGIQPRQNR